MLHPSSCRAVLFDLDGTLVDSSEDLAAALAHVLTEDGLEPIPVSRVLSLVGDGAAVLVDRAHAEHGRQPRPDALARFKAYYHDHCLEATQAYPGIPRLLEGLSRRGPRPPALAVVTNKPSTFARRVLDGLGLTRFFRLVLGPEDVPARKPSPEHVRAALEALDVPPAEAVMIGDGTTDLRAGREAGCATVAVHWGYRSRAALAAEGSDFVADSVDDLAGLLGVPRGPTAGEPR